MKCGRVCAPATLATASKEEDSDNARISATQNLNHASFQLWREGEGGREKGGDNHMTKDSFW